MPNYTTAPTLDDLTALAEHALDTMPAPLARMVEGVAIQVIDFPDDDTVAEMELESSFDLLGLYVGTPFGHKGGATPSAVDVIQLYRRPILDYWCDSGDDLYTVVRHVLIHEIGHHFGFSDEDMEALEREADQEG